MKKRTLEHFKKTIRDYYKKNKRNLPWRNTTNPYHIFISELMLQQTQVSRVVKKYKEFIKKFPDFRSLAKAPIRDVLMVWQGMGYNRRAKYLKESALHIERTYKGILPQDVQKVDELPGIGSATAGSIVCFSYNLPTLFIETNTRRVFIHFFFADKKGVDDKDIIPLLEATLDRENPREWYYALMDYGAMLGVGRKNANARSKHYKKQSPFKNSDRQIRGAIIRHLLKNKHSNENSLNSVLSFGQARIKKNLLQLRREGMIQEKKGNYFIV